jgi:UDP-N-acetylmuramate: L-alanyl-gamma-D-glutamyl-meso-diaminopimelate ligase
MELKAIINDIHIYDDFAHHPTAIATTLQGLRQRVNRQRIIVLLEPRSNTMRMGVHKSTLAAALETADVVILYQPPGLEWALEDTLSALQADSRLFYNSADIIDYLVSHVQAHDHILIMSNGSFDNIHQRLINALQEANEHTP